MIFRYERYFCSRVTLHFYIAVNFQGLLSFRIVAMLVELTLYYTALSMPHYADDGALHKSNISSAALT